MQHILRKLLKLVVWLTERSRIGLRGFIVHERVECTRGHWEQITRVAGVSPAKERQRALDMTQAKNEQAIITSTITYRRHDLERPESSFTTSWVKHMYHKHKTYQNTHIPTLKVIHMNITCIMGDLKGVHPKIKHVVPNLNNCFNTLKNNLRNVSVSFCPSSGSQWAPMLSWVWNHIRVCKWWNFHFGVNYTF